MGSAPKLDAEKLNEVASQAKSAAESQLFEIGNEKIELGNPDTLRYGVLTAVIDERYDQAIEDIKKNLKEDSIYPDYHSKADRLLNHMIDLVYATKAKRNFPGVSSLTRPKQQELREKYLQHFRELQQVIKRIENIESGLRVADAKSTIYIVRALWLAGFAIGGVAFFLEFIRGLARTSFVVIDDLYAKIISYLFNSVGM